MMQRRWWLGGLAAGIALAVAAPPAHAQIKGRIVRVGLSGGGSSCVREGCWTAVDVELDNQGPNTYSGRLQLEQLDRDGDVVVARADDVVLKPADRRVFRLYYVPSFVGGVYTVRVTLFDEAGPQTLFSDDNGQTRRHLESSQIDRIGGGETVLLEVASSGQSRLASLVYLTRRDGGGEIPDDRKLRIRAVEPAHLPNRWYALSLANVVIWDDPDLTGVEPDQLDALAQWVRSGGRLVLSSGRNWSALAQSKLAELLPVQLKGVRQAVHADVLGKIVPAKDKDAFKEYLLPDKITRGIVQRRGDAAAGIFIVPHDAGDDPMVFRRLYGRGVVTFVAAPLRELLTAFPTPRPKRTETGDIEEPDPARADADEFAAIGNRCRQLLRGLFQLPRPINPSEAMNFGARDLYEHVTRPIGFQQTSGAYLMFSLLFALAYGAVSTVGTWVWLGRRGWRHHAWTAYAAVAVLAMSLGTGAVIWLRGFTNRVNDVQIVDAWANLQTAQAECFFGLRTPGHAEVNIRLPTLGLAEDPQDDLGPLCALPVDSLREFEIKKYVAPTIYTLRRECRRLDDVTIRATLKEFEGLWQGTLDGDQRLDAKLISQRGGGRNYDMFVAPSHVRNCLGCDLRNCVLLETSEDQVVKTVDVHCFELGDLPAGAAFDGASFDAIYKSTEKRADVNAEAEGDESIKYKSVTAFQLDSAMRNWNQSLQSALGGTDEADRGFKRLIDVDRAMLLLSTFGVAEPEKQYNFRRSGGHRIDCLHQLTRHTAILIGFTDAPGPATLEVGNKPQKSTKSLTMYRFVVPIERK